MSKNWSTYQRSIFDDVANGTGHILVEALAGSGKSTTIIESLKYIPSGKTWLLVAFNKRIAEDLKLKAPPGATGDISTLHSLGLKSIGKTYKNIKVDNDKAENIIKKILGKSNESRELQHNLVHAVGLAKGFLAHTSAEIDEVLDEYEIDCAEMPRDEFINHILVCLDLCKSNPKVVDFNDMIWLPNVLKIDVPKYDRVFVDEAQDMSRAQIGLVLKAVQGPPKTKKSKPEGRICLIGDGKQALYSWRGAELDILQTMKEQLNAKVFSLPISYRCPLAVVREAQKIVPEFQAAPNAIQGKVAWIDIEQMKKEARPGCFILSRVNAPLIGLTLHFIKNGIPANIQGRDIGENLLTIVKRSKAKTVDKLLDYVEKWKTKECQRLLKKNKNTDHIVDKAECLAALCEGISSVQEVKTNINKLFNDVDDSKKIVLGSIHRSKGMERDVVYVLASTLRDSNQEEKNIRYVGYTRSKRDLYLVRSKSKSKAKIDELAIDLGIEIDDNF